MSGLAAVLHREGGPAPEGPLRAMAEALAHRGVGTPTITMLGPAGLAQLESRSRSTSSAETARPSASPPANARLAALHVVADARIDNRAELRAAGLDVDDGMTAAEVIGRAYEKWSTECTARLLGDFAFVVWDAERRQLYCARDHIGVRPLYYRADGRLFSCASEPHALRHASPEPLRPNALEIALFLIEEHREAGPSLYQGIDALPHGSRRGATREETRPNALGREPALVVHPYDRSLAIAARRLFCSATCCTISRSGHASVPRRVRGAEPVSLDAKAGAVDFYAFSQAAFREGGRPEISPAISRRETPSASSVRSRRSIETNGSAASIFATRDWLDRTARARAAWVTPRLWRCCRSPSESLRRISMYCSSAAESPRNSPAVPTRQPVLSNFFRFASRMVVLPKPPDARVNAADAAAGNPPPVSPPD